MKFLLVLALTFASVSSYASNAVDKFTSYLPIGYYSGVNDQGTACTVSVAEVNYPKKDIQIRVVVGNSDLTKLIEEDSLYRSSYCNKEDRNCKREFVLTDRNLIGSDDMSYVESIIRTVSTGDKKQYVVVSYSVVVNTEANTEIAECIVDL